MRVHLLTVSVVALIGLAPGPLGFAAQTPAASEPTLEQLRESVASLRGGRIARPTSYDDMTPEQQSFVRGILSGPRRDISGSLGVMMVSPGFGEHAQRAIAYGRFAGQDGYSSVPPRLSELAILMGARAWSADYAWHAHHQYAVRMGLGADVVEAVRVGRRPANMEPDVEAVYDFLHELLADKRVSDATFEAARTVLGGDRGIVDLVGTLGMYQTVAMLMVVDQFPLPDGVAPYLERLE